MPPRLCSTPLELAFDKGARCAQLDSRSLPCEKKVPLSPTQYLRTLSSDAEGLCSPEGGMGACRCSPYPPVAQSLFTKPHGQGADLKGPQSGKGNNRKIEKLWCRHPLTTRLRWELHEVTPGLCQAFCSTVLCRLAVDLSLGSSSAFQILLPRPDALRRPTGLL